MPRSTVRQVDLAPLIVAALNAVSVNGGTIEAVLRPGGQAIGVRTHIDSGAPQQTYEIVIR